MSQGTKNRNDHG